MLCKGVCFVKGRIHSYQSMGTLDGPGVRFVVFMQGCMLNCGYCHNPDTKDFSLGTEVSAREILEKVLRYRGYFGEKGGITVSGGEPLFQAEFLYELFSLCKKEGIHTVLDTSGAVFNEKVEKLLSVTDLVLLDIKMTNENHYEKYIGMKLEKVLFFLEELQKRNIDTWIRQVIVPTLNDTKENILMLNEILKGKTCVKKVELLPFKKLCKEKYEKMGIEFSFDIYPTADTKKVKELEKLIELKGSL